MNAFGKALSLLHKHFKLIWVINTLMFLVPVLLLNAHYSYKRTYKEVYDTSKDVGKNMDGFIEDLYQEVYTLPLYGKNIRKCTPELDDFLEHIVINNPSISGLVIRDTHHHVICSTINDNQPSTTLSGPARTILGPFEHSFFEQPIYLVRQKIGPYYIDIVLVASILQAEMELPETLSSAVALYSQWDKKNIIKIQRNEEQNGWILNPDLQATKPDAELMHVVNKLQSIDGIALEVFVDKETIKKHLLLNELLVLIGYLLGSYILYLLINQNLSKDYSLNRAMKLAIKNKQFYPVYQPVFDNQNNRFCGVELLLRWQDHEGCDIMPDSFIEQAESTGLIIPISLQVIEIAFQELTELLNSTPDFYLAINLSMVHFKTLHFFSQFDTLRMHYGIQSKHIILEVTERELLDINDNLLTTKMGALREAGFSLAVDDYGTGHASISYLQHFPFNYLKIDKLFIHAIGTNAITESLNDAIIFMAKSLNLTLIAEGVETQEQIDYLEKNNVRYLQGWYFSKGVSIDTIRELVQGKRHGLSN